MINRTLILLALVAILATACKREEPAATAEPATTSTTAPTDAVNSVDATSTVENTTAATDAGALDSKAIAGRFGDGESVLELRADGSYVQTLQAGGNVISTDGNWNVVDSDGLLLDPNSKSAEDVRFRVVSNDELLNGDGTRTFRRVSGQ